MSALLPDAQHVALVAEFHGRHLEHEGPDHDEKRCLICFGYRGFLDMTPEERQLAQADMGALPS